LCEQRGRRSSSASSKGGRHCGAKGQATRLMLLWSPRSSTPVQYEPKRCPLI
jgi:hypothetical protein